MAELVKATYSMAEDILPIFAEFNNPAPDSPQWRSLLRPPWNVSEDYCGYALFEKRRIVGFIGMVFSSRTVAGREERFCNVSSLVTLPGSRGEALKLVAPLLRLKDYTVTCFTPSDKVHDLLTRLGFQALDESMHILLPLPEPAKTLGNLGRVVSVTTRGESLVRRLRPEHRAIYDAHQLPGCLHLLIREDGDDCYVVFGKTQGRRWSFSCIHYLSEPGIFFANLNRAKLRMALLSGTPLIMLMDRFAQGGSLGYKRTASIRIPPVYKSARLDRRQIDGLYSELQLLNI